MLTFAIVIAALFLLAPVLPIWRIIWHPIGETKWYVIDKSYGFLWTEPHIMYVLQHCSNAHYGRAIIGINIPLLMGSANPNPGAFKLEDKWGKTDADSKDILHGTMFHK